MDQDQKLMIFLDSLGPEADADFAKQLLQEQDWDLQAALEVVTGSVPGPPESLEAYPQEVRAPLRTGYVDRLIDDEERVDVGRHLEAALRASEQDFLREAEIQEQVALAAAMEASCASHRAPPDLPVPGERRVPERLPPRSAAVPRSRTATRSYPQGQRSEAPVELRPKAVPGGRPVRPREEPRKVPKVEPKAARLAAGPPGRPVPKQSAVRLAAAPRPGGKARPSAQAPKAPASPPAQPPAAATAPAPVADEAARAAAERFAQREAEELRREREEAERKRSAETSLAEPDGLVTALQALRRRHLKTDPKGLAACLQTLRAYISNLAKYPQEAKYQSINCENSHFRGKVACMEGAVAVLEACGFVAHENKMMVDGRGKASKLWDALSKVDVMLEQVK